MTPEEKKDNDGSLINQASAVPDVIDQEIIMDMVHEYVEAERERSKKIILWISTVFLFVVFLVLTLFVSIGIFILQNSRKATDMVDGIQAQTAFYASEVVDISNKIGGIERNYSDFRESVEQNASKRVQNEKALKTNLERFSEWVGSSIETVKQETGTLDVSDLRARIKQLEVSEAERNRELDNMKKQYLAYRATVNNTAGSSQSRSSSESQGAYDAESSVPDEEVSISDEELMPGLTVNLFADLPGKLDRPEWSRGKNAVVALPDGSRYEGEFQRGKFNGWGALYYQNGDVYEGEFKDDKFEGRGMKTYKNGNQYVGDFSDGKKHGKGVFRFLNRDVYKGEFRNDIRSGQGAYFFSDGSRYIGSFVNGLRDGKGKYIYTNGAEYVGDFKDGAKEGYGVYIAPNGQRRKGLWQANKFIKAVN